MTAFNQALNKLSAVLGNPKPQHPTLDQRFTQLSFEVQNIYNELTNSHLPWTRNEITVNINTGTQDYLIPGNIGTILFAYANPANGVTGPIGLDITDLAKVSSDFYPFNPLDTGFSPDFNEVIPSDFPSQISFYRDASGNLKFKLAPFRSGVSSITLIAATGDWIDNLDPQASPILSQHIMLPIVRAAQNLLADCEWLNGKELAQGKAAVLSSQEARYAQQFMFAKRSLNADTNVSRRIPLGGDW
jgi:hypothetical protein